MERLVSLEIQGLFIYLRVIFYALSDVGCMSYLSPMKCILGTKVSMTRVFDKDGKQTPVTMVQTGQCAVTQVRSIAKDGVSAVQIGFGHTKKLAKPQQNHLKGLPAFKELRDFRIEGNDSFKRGDAWDASVFAVGDVVAVTGTAKGRGFQGVVKRHKFHGSPASHGHKDQLRMPGSIGSKRQGPVQKGKRMPGHMGTNQVTVQNLEVVMVDVENQILYIKGAVPGARGSFLSLYGEGSMTLKPLNMPEVEVAEVAAPVAHEAPTEVVETVASEITEEVTA